MALDEFGLIRRYFTRSAAGMSGPNAPGLRLGIGDDAALLDLPAGETLAVTTDTLVAGRHFPADATAADIAWKALAVNLSDLAAMGARPLGVTLALTLPEVDEAWLADFSTGFFALADAHGVPLIGGDTTRGPLSITVTALGSVPAEQALRRDGARVGDLIHVSGTPGDAGLGLALALGRTDAISPNLSDVDRQHALSRLHRPTPRLALGLALRGLASAALDISDGLVQDLGHVLSASSTGASAFPVGTPAADAPLGAMLALDRLPLSPALSGLMAQGETMRAQVLNWVLSAGDDYELLFTVPPARAAEVAGVASALALPLTCIGQITADGDLQLTWQGCRWSHPVTDGYRHFS